VCDKYIEELRVAVPELEIFTPERCYSENYGEASSGNWL
jgi:hypothetical protein